MGVNYWLDLFTGTTWKEFREAGGSVSLSAKRRSVALRVQNGDILICYLTGVMRWVGALEVISPSIETRRIWKDREFPVRFNVKPLIMLEPEHGIPMENLEGLVTFFQGAKDRGKFQGLLRGSPTRFKNSKDAELIIKLLRQAERHPIPRPVDPKKLARKPFYRVEPKRGATKQVMRVSVPEPEDTPSASATQEAQETAEPATTRHTEMQYQLLSLGSGGLDV